jgi:hypothetical protein
MERDPGALYALAKIGVADGRGDQVHRPAEKPFQRILEAEEGVGVAAGR